MSRSNSIVTLEGFISALRRRLNAIERTLAAPQDQWTAPVLQAGFANSGAPDAVAGYYRDTLAVVHLKGVLTVPAAASGQTIFTLPAGYRPTENHRFGVVQGTVNSARVDVSAAGVVSFQGAGGTAAIDLSAVFFRAEQ